MPEEPPKIWIYPHKDGEHGFELGIDEFRCSLVDDVAYGEKWNHNIDSAEKGDTIIFAFKEGEQWFVVGDGVVRERGEPDPEQKDQYEVGYTIESVRLYPRNVSYAELERNLASFNPDAHMKVKLLPDDYLRLLKNTVMPRL